MMPAIGSKSAANVRKKKAVAKRTEKTVSRFRIFFIDNHDTGCA